jgi:lysozyme
MSRSIQEPGLRIIKHFEKCRLKAYLPTPDDVPTIGWGHTLGVELGDTCSQEQADVWLKEDCQDAENAVNYYVRLPITQNQFDALVSFVFNIGGPRFRASTLLRKLNSGDYAGASAEFPHWRLQKGKVLNGLIKRRAMERELFLTPATPECML